MHYPKFGLSPFLVLTALLVGAPACSDDNSGGVGNSYGTDPSGGGTETSAGEAGDASSESGSSESTSEGESTGDAESESSGDPSDSGDGDSAGDGDSWGDADTSSSDTNAEDGGDGDGDGDDGPVMGVDCWDLPEENCVANELYQCYPVLGQPFIDDGNGGLCTGPLEFAYCAPLVPCNLIFVTMCEDGGEPLYISGDCPHPDEWADCAAPSEWMGANCE